MPMVGVFGLLVLIFLVSGGKPLGYSCCVFLGRSVDDVSALVGHGIINQSLYSGLEPWSFFAACLGFVPWLWLTNCPTTNLPLCVPFASRRGAKFSRQGHPVQPTLPPSPLPRIGRYLGQRLPSCRHRASQPGTLHAPHFCMEASHTHCKKSFFLPLPLWPPISVLIMLDQKLYSNRMMCVRVLENKKKPLSHRSKRSNLRSSTRKKEKKKSVISFFNIQVPPPPTVCLSLK